MPYKVLSDETAQAAATVDYHILVADQPKHDDVDGLWYFAADEGSAAVERLSAANMKRTWVSHGFARDWTDPQQAEGPEFLRHATQVKNIWVPYGE